MARIMVRITRPLLAPLCRMKCMWFESLEEAKDAIRNMDKEGVTKISIWEKKEEINL